MALKHMGYRASPSTIDLLIDPFAGAPGIYREDTCYVVSLPWATAEFGLQALHPGWWKFECEGEGDLSGVELRLITPQDGLLAFSPIRFLDHKAFFPTRRTAEVSLLISPWPGRFRFSKLRIRKISRMEEARLLYGAVSRLTNSAKPLTKTLHIMRRVIGGRSMRLGGGLVSPETVPIGSSMTTAASSNYEVVSKSGLTVVLRADERLHPHAMEIAKTVFSRAPNIQAAYADRWSGNKLRPLPQWDCDLAANYRFVDSPVFFRGEGAAMDPWPRLVEFSNQPGSIVRIPLPLSRRDMPFHADIPAIPTPALRHPTFVSIVIPTKARLDLLARCLYGISRHTELRQLEVVIVDNGAERTTLNELVARASLGLSIRRVEHFGPFNYSRLINHGVRSSRGDVIVTLNDDVEPISDGWLARLLDSVAEEKVGCVGARLLYPDRSIQHAGVTLGLSGVCGHLWKGLNEAEARQIPQVVLPSGRMAVTGACLAFRREVFELANGFDEANFPVALNDVDFCLRVGALGFRTVYRGDAALIHHESQSRGHDDETQERRSRLALETVVFLDRWRHRWRDDPFASPAYDQTMESGTVHPALIRSLKSISL